MLKTSGYDNLLKLIQKTLELLSLLRPIVQWHI